MRSGEQLADAYQWYKDRDIKLYGINANPSQHHWTESPKIYAHLVIDDNTLGCPLIVDDYSDRPYVDWNQVENYLEKHSII